MPPKRPAGVAFKSPKRTTSKTTRKAISKPKTMSGKTSNKPGHSRKEKASTPVAVTASSEDEDTASDGEDSAADTQASEGTSTSASDEDDQSESETTPQQRQQIQKIQNTRGPNAQAIRNSKTASSRAVRNNTSLSKDADDEEEAPTPAAPASVVPEKLLTSLLYSHFQRSDTKIGRGARELVGRYVETFIREAVARAVVERKGGTGLVKNGGGGGDFLEVEDLEKLAPQLILDF